MRQGIDTGNRKAKIGIELIRDPQGVRLESETKELPISGIVEIRAQDFEGLDFLRCTCHPTKLLGFNTNETDIP